MNVARIGWIPLEEFENRYQHRFCETPRHRGGFHRSITVVAVAGKQGTAEDGLLEVFGACPECFAMLELDSRSRLT